MTMQSLQDYAEFLMGRAGQQLANCQIFAKVLAPNDDSGRHGVVIPVDSYDFFPELMIPDPGINSTRRFYSFDAIGRTQESLAFKYYQRYPERRITRVNTLINDREKGLRLQVFLRGEQPSGAIAYIHDASSEFGDRRLRGLWGAIAGEGLQPVPGAYLSVPVKFAGLRIDSPLGELLNRFDEIRGRWIDSLRSGDTGIGYTFETLLGIEENNDQTADFQGIELKCKKQRPDRVVADGKLNLFQSGPTWTNQALKSIDRLKLIGQIDSDGFYRCYSQVTTTENNLTLRLNQAATSELIELQKAGEPVGYWPHKTLERRLLEKHSRAAFILAKVREGKSGVKYSYDELIYCEKPTIDRFLDLVTQNRLVFEFTMREDKKGGVRNHGYPWRLVRESLLDQLFTVRVKLR